MSLLGKVFIVLFMISLGKSPGDVQEFNRIKGEWRVVGVQENGKRGSLQEWEDKKIVFAEANEKAEKPSDSILFEGRLNSKQKPAALEKMTITLALSDITPDTTGKEGEAPAGEKASEQNIRRTRIEGEICGIVEVRGDAMKLLLKRLKDADAKRPTRFVTVPKDDCFLLELRRAKTGSPEKPKSTPTP